MKLNVIWLYMYLPSGSERVGGVYLTGTVGGGQVSTAWHHVTWAPPSTAGMSGIICEHKRPNLIISLPDKI